MIIKNDTLYDFYLGQVYCDIKGMEFRIDYICPDCIYLCSNDKHNYSRKFTPKEYKHLVDNGVYIYIRTGTVDYCPVREGDILIPDTAYVDGLVPGKEYYIDDVVGISEYIVIKSDDGIDILDYKDVPEIYNNLKYNCRD